MWPQLKYGFEFAFKKCRHICNSTTLFMSINNNCDKIFPSGSKKLIGQQQRKIVNSREKLLNTGE